MNVLMCSATIKTSRGREIQLDNFLLTENYNIDEVYHEAEKLVHKNESVVSIKFKPTRLCGIDSVAIDVEEKEYHWDPVVHKKTKE